MGLIRNDIADIMKSEKDMWLNNNERDSSLVSWLISVTHSIVESVISEST